MTEAAARMVVLETLANINRKLAVDPNALTSTKSGVVGPEAAYVELVRELLSLVAKEE